jgi:mannose-6-phosphate isomerase-like protein (cupin superfamily)
MSLVTGIQHEAGAGRAIAVERSAPNGHMGPLHTREHDETYRVLEGTVTFYVGREVVAAGAGDVVVAPAGSPRTFRVDSQRARWLVRTRVDSVERFLDFGRAVAPPLPDSSAGWPSAEEHATVAAIAAVNGIRLLGPPGALPAG